MKKFLYLITSTLMIIFISGNVYAELKIGIVNLNSVLQKSPITNSINKDLMQRFQSRQKELENSQKQLQDDTNKLTINAENLSSDDLNKLRIKIATDQANLQIATTTLQKDVAIAKDQAMQKFTTKFKDAVQKVAQAGNYDLIEQSNNILFIKPELDITQQVLNEMK